jgi:predicted O-methyltransferase YrrM
LQGRILSFISRLNNPGKILELGTFTGYSALCLAEGLVENGRLITVEQDREFDKIIKKYIDKSPYKENIEVVYGDALEFMKTLNETFDIIFVDAYKLDYILYYEQAVRLLRKGGLIITDNVLWSGKVIFEIDDKTALALNEFNKHVKGDKRVERVMIPVRDGISLIMKK